MDRQLFQQDRKARRVVHVGMGGQNKVNLARAVECPNVLNQRLSRLLRSTVNDDDGLLSRRAREILAEAQCNSITAPLTLSYGEKIDFVLQCRLQFSCMTRLDLWAADAYSASYESRHHLKFKLAYESTLHATRSPSLEKQRNSR